MMFLGGGGARKECASVQITQGHCTSCHPPPTLYAPLFLPYLWEGRLETRACGGAVVSGWEDVRSEYLVSQKWKQRGVAGPAA